MQPCFENAKIRRDISLKNYLTAEIYKDIPILNQKIKKISSKDFSIPKLQNYHLLQKHNYNIKQLKTICRHYKQKVSGNKKQLLQRCYNFMRLSGHCMLIQKLFRGYLQREYDKVRGPGYFKRNVCVNDTDFYSLEKITSIPRSQFFSFKSEDEFIYGFNICSLFNLILNSGMRTKNPYNRYELPADIVNKIRRQIRLSHVLKIPITIVIKNDDDKISPQKKLEMRIIALFQKIDELGNYTNFTWFTALSRSQLVKYIRELADIWTYRAELSPIIKRNVCPPNGNPFIHFNIETINTITNDSLKRYCITIMENIVIKGINRDSQMLGAYYVLAALTLVSEEAAIAMPWLYQSVAHHA